MSMHFLSSTQNKRGEHIDVILILNRKRIKIYLLSHAERGRANKIIRLILMRNWHYSHDGNYIDLSKMFFKKCFVEGVSEVDRDR